MISIVLPILLFLRKRVVLVEKLSGLVGVGWGIGVGNLAKQYWKKPLLI